MNDYYTKENEDSDTISLVKEKSTSECKKETSFVPIEVPRPSVLRGITSYIIVTEFCERLSYYGFAGSLVLFLQRQFGQTNAEADISFSLWSGFCYLTPLIGGYFADKWYGRFHTIVFFSIIYVIGLLLTVISARPSDSANNKNNLGIIFYIAIYIIALATGGIKPNVSSLGADQFDMDIEQDRKESISFFNYFYWSVNLGALIAYTIVTYICQYGINGLGGEQYSFVVGYSIPLIAMFLGLIVFVIGNSKYKKRRPNGSVIDTTVSIIYEALWIKRNVKFGSNNKILDKAKLSYGGSYTDYDVNNVMLVLQLLPFLAAFIPYWGVYSQMSTAFQNQACQMDLSYRNTQIPVASINAADTIIILILVPIFDQFLYPYLKQKNIIKIDMLSKINYGFLFAMLAMIAAALIEIYRRRCSPKQGNYYDINARNNITPCRDIYDYNPYDYMQWYNNSGNSIENNKKPLYCHQINGCDINVDGINCVTCDYIPQMSKLSVLWLTPQYCLIGISEILSSVTSLEFFYSQAPVNMISIVQAFNLVTTAFGSWLVIPLILLANCNPDNQWVPINLDDGSLELYFMLLIIIMALTIYCFHKISKNYNYINTNDSITGNNITNEDEINIELNKL